MTALIERLTAALSGRYAIEREIGRGGMATVYLARDLRHDRRVALKLLLPELGAVIGPERFLTEIRVTAHLQHPNLLPLFDSGEVPTGPSEPARQGLPGAGRPDGAGLPRAESRGPSFLYYVMPFVDGESLRARLDRERQLPVQEAVRIAAAVASALDHAHRHGVVHRDLKPENILLQDGQPMVADFGIALAVAKAGGARITQTGLSLGTPAYMSPEQATGDRGIDGRTDIYSLGAVLYEMLAGDPPHSASTAQAIIAKVLTERPQLIRAVRETVPAHVEAAIERALSKLPADRFATAREFEEAITGVRPIALPGRHSTVHGSAARSTKFHGVQTLAPWAIALAGVAAGVIGWNTRRTAAVPRVRFVLALADSAPVVVGPGPVVALSPDGLRLAYVAEPATGPSRIFVRAMNEIEAKPLPGTEQAIRPSFSPNGEWIAFTVGNRLRKIPAGGGTPVPIADDVGPYSWGDGDVVAFARADGRGGGAGLWRVSANGGSPQRLTVPDTTRGEAHLFPHVLPGGKAVIFTVVGALGVETATLAAVRLDTGGRVTDLGIVGVSPRYVQTGHVVLGRFDGTAVAVPFDADRLEVTGPPVTIVDSILVKGGGAMELSVAPNGTAVFLEGSRQRRLVLVDRAGREESLADAAAAYSRPRLSPDGRRVAVARQTGAESDIWIYDLDSHTWTRLTNDGRNAAPEWTPDGRRVVWLHGPRGQREMASQAWDGSEPARMVSTRIGTVDAAVPSPDGRFMVLLVFAGNPLSGDLYITRTDSGARVEPLLVTPESENHPAISPDGRWLAYVSSESGQRFVHLRRMSGAPGRTVISAAAAVEPRWSRDGRQLFYRSGGRILAATIDTSPPVRVVRRDTLFADTYAFDIGTGYDVTAGATRFLFAKPDAESNRVVVALGWLDELREQMTKATAR